MRDPEFINKFVYAINVYNFRWMGSCAAAIDRESVANDLINLYNILSLIIGEYPPPPPQPTMRLVHRGENN